MADEEKQIDEFTGVETTGHSWDGIKELNNPLPRWWLWTFYATIAWALIYTIMYPAWPLLNSATQGVLGWSSRGDLIAAQQEAVAQNADKVSRLAEMDINAILADNELRTFAENGGKAAFKVNCVQCHGSGAAGSEGYPNLNDDEWIWGGTPEAILYTLQHGIRYEQNDQTRISMMPAFGADGILSNEEIRDIAWYVVQMSGGEADSAAAERGASLYSDNCAACHGEDGGGIQDLGAPRLSDAIWLYGGNYDEIVAQIQNPQMGVMPAWEERLGNVTLKQLTAYVHSLGGGQ